MPALLERLGLGRAGDVHPVADVALEAPAITGIADFLLQANVAFGSL